MDPKYGPHPSEDMDSKSPAIRWKFTSLYHTCASHPDKKLAHSERFAPEKNPVKLKLKDGQLKELKDGQ